MKYIFPIIVGLIVSFVQLGLLNWVEPYWLVVNLPLLAILWFVFNRQGYEMAVVAIITGLLLDGLSSWGIGVNILSLLAAAFAMTSVTTGILPREEQAHIILGVLAIGHLAYLLSVFVLQSALSIFPMLQAVSFMGLVGWSTITQVAAAALFYLVIIKPLGRVYLIKNK